jgi:hypothetical protein
MFNDEVVKTHVKTVVSIGKRRIVFRRDLPVDSIISRLQKKGINMEQGGITIVRYIARIAA